MGTMMITSPIGHVVNYLRYIPFLGGVVQVDPMKPMLKPPGTNLLKLKYDKPLSNIAFKFNWRRYTSAASRPPSSTSASSSPASRQGLPDCSPRHSMPIGRFRYIASRAPR
jgi:hypothetical protein